MKSAHQGFAAVKHLLELSDNCPCRAFCERNAHDNSPFFRVSPDHRAMAPTNDPNNTVGSVNRRARHEKARHYSRFGQWNVASIINVRLGTPTHIVAPSAFHSHGDAIPALGSRKVTFSGGVS